MTPAENPPQMEMEVCAEHMLHYLGTVKNYLAGICWWNNTSLRCSMTQLAPLPDTHDAWLCRTRIRLVQRARFLNGRVYVHPL